MTKVDILIPESQREGTELELGTWLKLVGDRVEKDEPVAELVTDKAVVELAAPVAGILVEILVPESTRIEELGAVLGRIDSDEAARTDAPAPSTEPSPPPPAPANPPVEAKDQRSDRPPPHPAVVRFAAARGIELSRVQGTGDGGRVTARDLGASHPSPSAAPLPKETGLGPTRWVRHDPMRRAIARTMAESVRTAPHVTAVFDCDLKQVVEHRDRHKDGFSARGVPLTFSAYFLQAMVRGVKAAPEVNARFHEDGLEIFESVHVGVGTATDDGGIVVPVVRDVQDLDLEGTARALFDLTTKARAQRLSAAEMKGSTLTVSNHGVMGSLFASPIILRPPEVAIVGIGKLEQRVVAEDNGGVEVRPRLYVSLTIDHRAIDASHTNRFLAAFVAALEGWPTGA